MHITFMKHHFRAFIRHGRRPTHCSAGMCSMDINAIWLCSVTPYYKFCTSSKPASSQVRVRFAPSPTGHLHLGGLRTALYNYLMARSHNGSFILRIEDTDQTRLVPGAAEALYEMLQWAGIAPDESAKHGGPRGPYVQSERRHLYQKYAQELVDRGAAYSCFCSPARLEVLRKQCLQQNTMQRYDNRCRGLSSAKTAELTRQGVPHCIRLKLRPISPHVDAILGSGTFAPVSPQEGDPVILKTCGQATYHLANVVDDHLMAITHVIRGDEWLSSTSKHLIIYDSLQWEPPVFAHLPILLNTDGAKMSKRQDNNRVAHLRSLGYSSRTLLNLVLGIQDSVHSLPELVEKFSLLSISKSKTKIDMERLGHLSRLDLQRSVRDSREVERTVMQLRDLVLAECVLSPDSPLLQSSCLRRVLQSPLTLQSVSTLHQLVTLHRYLWLAPETRLEELLRVHEAPGAVLQGIYASLSSLTSDSFVRERVLPSVGHLPSHSSNGMKITKAALMKLLRLTLCGCTVGAPVGDVLEVLGREESLRRIQHAVSLCRADGGSSHACPTQ